MDSMNWYLISWILTFSLTSLYAPSVHPSLPFMIVGCLYQTLINPTHWPMTKHMGGICFSLMGVIS